MSIPKELIVIEVFFIKEDYYYSALVKSMSRKHLPLCCYEKVAEFPDTMSEEEIFTYCQNGIKPLNDGSWGKRNLRSMSVGDIIKYPDGKMIVCSSLGWENYFENW